MSSTLLYLKYPEYNCVGCLRQQKKNINRVSGPQNSISKISGILGTNAAFRFNPQSLLGNEMSRQSKRNDEKYFWGGVVIEREMPQ